MQDTPDHRVFFLYVGEQAEKTVISSDIAPMASQTIASDEFCELS